MPPLTAGCVCCVAQLCCRLRDGGPGPGHQLAKSVEGCCLPPHPHSKLPVSPPPPPHTLPLGPPLQLKTQLSFRSPPSGVQHQRGKHQRQVRCQGLLGAARVSAHQPTISAPSNEPPPPHTHTHTHTDQGLGDQLFSRHYTALERQYLFDAITHDTDIDVPTCPNIRAGGRTVHSAQPFDQGSWLQVACGIVVSVVLSFRCWFIIP